MSLPGPSRKACRAVLVHAIIALASLGAGSLCAGEPKVKVFVSSLAGDRMAPRSPISLTPGEQEGRPSFTIDETTTHQAIAGFGASFLEAGMICLNSLPAEEQEGVLRALFDAQHGAGFSAMKTVIAGTDFMSAGPWYTYDDTPGDVTMAHFSIARDLGPDGLVTYIKKASRHGEFVLQAPMDYPPDWMLTSVAERSRQDVQERYLGALALYELRYLQEYRKQGITIDYLSPFNEPGVYTKIPYTRIRDLIKFHLGPLLERERLATKLMLSEAPTRAAAAQEYPIVLDDPAARKYVAALPYHGYGFGDFALVEKLHRRYPDLPLWMTELCHADTSTPATTKLPRTDFEDGVFWGDQIVSDLEAHASAWIYWNMILDQKGGPWLVSPIHGNPDPNVQHPLVIIDRNSKQVTYTGAYYFLAHFSKFVRPGSVRVTTIGTQTGVRCIAFLTPGKGLAVELLNNSNDAAETRIIARGSHVRLQLPPMSISTAVWPSSS